MGLNFAIYESSKSFLGRQSEAYLASKNEGKNPDPPPKGWSVWSLVRSTLSGGFAGGVSKLVVFPLDTIKKRMQAQVLQNTLSGMGQLPRYRGMTHCFVDTWRQEGLGGLYKVKYIIF